MFSRITVILALAATLAGCADGADDEPKKPTRQTVVVPSLFNFTVIIVNNAGINLEVDYYAWAHGGAVDYGSTRAVRPGNNTYPNFLPVGYSTYEISIAAYYGNDDDYGPERIKTFSNSEKGPLWAIFTIDRGERTALEIQMAPP